jgi:muramoyltetrapeptide carboxypeptidase
MTVLKPPAIGCGDRIALIAPASPFPRDEFDAGVLELRTMGFDPVWDESVFARDAYVAGAPDVRAQAFLSAWRDPSIGALLCVRGGYGSVHVLPHLSVMELRKKPKLLIGYSDITALLSFITTRAGIAAVHGPTVAGRFSRGTDGYDRESFLCAIGAADGPADLSAVPLETIRPGEARGVLLGGNLTQLVATLGTPYAFDPSPGSILFLEDVNERPYRIDRMLTQLDQAGILRRASALIFGEMPGCHEADGSLQARDGVLGGLRRFTGPVVWGMPSGHTPGPAISLPLGVRVTVTAGARATLHIDESAVS